MAEETRIRARPAW